MIARSEVDAPCKVTLDGVDISQTCFFADDEAGVVYCYVRVPNSPSTTAVELDAAGNPCFERKTGVVVIEKRIPLKHPFAG